MIESEVTQEAQSGSSAARHATALEFGHLWTNQKGHEMGIGQKYVLPTVLGFVGMFVCHFGLFLCQQAGIKFTAYLIVYPIVYPILTFVITIVESRLWLTNALFLCIIPFLYWYILLWTDGSLNVHSLSLFGSSGMSVIILLTLVLSLLVGYVVSQLRRSKRPTA